MNFHAFLGWCGPGKKISINRPVYIYPSLALQLYKQDVFFRDFEYRHQMQTVKIEKNIFDSTADFDLVPDGFSVRFYKKGDEQFLLKIQFQVGEFDSVSDGLNCFKNYLNFEDELKNDKSILLMIKLMNLLQLRLLGFLN